jgi:hypothetical protein
MMVLQQIAGRVVITLRGARMQVRAELTASQARTMRAELDELIFALETGEDRVDSLGDLIQQVGIAGVA